MMNLYQLRSFVTVIGEGSMTGAADKLYLTQPAISQQIRNLEEHLGVNLLARGVRQIAPTLQGEILYNYAKKILQMTQQAEVAVKAIGTELKGRLRVGTLNSLGIHIMSPIVSRLLKYNPQLSIHIDYDMGIPLIEAFRRGDLDLIVLPDVEKEYQETLGDVEAKYLMSMDMWLVGSGKVIDIPKQISLSELGTYPLIQLTREIPTFLETLEKVCPEPKLHRIFESPNVGTLKRVIETGLGWGFLPSLSVKKQVRMGRLIQVDVKDFSYRLEFYLYHKKKAENKPLIEMFYQTLDQIDRD